MVQGDNRSGTKGKNCILVMTHKQISKMRSKGKKPTYARVVVDSCPQKEDPNRFRITAGGNLIKYAGELTTQTADLTTAKMLWNSVISTDGAKFMGLDIGDFAPSVLIMLFHSILAFVRSAVRVVDSPAYFMRFPPVVILDLFVSSF